MGEKCKVSDVIFPSGCEARAINLRKKNVNIGIFTGATSVRSKNIFTDISRYPTGKHEIIQFICHKKIEFNRVYFLRFCTNDDTWFSKYRIGLIVSSTDATKIISILLYGINLKMNFEPCSVKRGRISFLNDNYRHIRAPLA